MEAVKKLPMISFELKNSPEPTSFHNLKQVTGWTANLIRLVFSLCANFTLIAVTHPEFVLFICLPNSALLNTTMKIQTRMQESSGNWSSYEALPSGRESTLNVVPPSSDIFRNYIVFRIDFHCHRRMSCSTLHGRTFILVRCGAAVTSNTKWPRFCSTSLRYIPSWESKRCVAIPRVWRLLARTFNVLLGHLARWKRNIHLYSRATCQLS